MRSLHELDEYRDTSDDVRAFFGSIGGRKAGAFLVPAQVMGEQLRVIASSDAGWDHVSVSARNRCPSWEEMEQVKRMFFKPTEVAMQLHVPVTEHINCHVYTLHLWRPTFASIPKPPGWMVGPKPEKLP